jgi:HSP20 family protein
MEMEELNMARRRGWGPVTDLVTMRQAMDDLFDETWARRSMGWRQGERMAALPLDAYSTDNELIIKASVPGAAPEDVQIKGELKAPLENVDYHIQERRHGAFGRTLTLNVPVEAEQAEATFEHGELTLIIPKSEESRPKVIQVKSKQD